MSKVILISNLNGCNDLTIKMLDSLVGERTHEKALELSDMFPINVGAMIGKPKEILKAINEGNNLYIRSEDFPNTIWFYGAGDEPLQLELVDVDNNKKFKIIKEGNKEVIKYLN